MIRLSSFIFLILIFSILISSCSNDKFIDKKTMADAYVDILIVKETYQSNRDSLIAYQKEVFKKYGISEKAYEATLKSFKFNKDAWNDFFKTVYARIDTLKNIEVPLNKANKNSNVKKLKP